MGKNRVIEAKRLKKLRRGRYAIFSGSTTQFHPDRSGGKVLVGEISLSKQVINTGRGPDNTRMAEYYQRIHSYDESLPKTLGLTEPMKDLMEAYKKVIRETPREMRISLVNNTTGMLDLYFNGMQFFFVDVDYKKKTIRRSRIYNSKDYALRMLHEKKITWVEHVSPRSSCGVE